MFALYPELQSVMKNGGVYFIDDLNASFHPLLVRNFILTVSVGRFSPFRVGLKTPISVNLKSPMHHVCY